jgi:hypothetical protein
VTGAALSNLRTFGFDFVFGQQVSTGQLYTESCQAAVDDVLRGFNATIFAYGQTGTGKTFTMLGDPEMPGVSLLAARDLFSPESRQSAGCGAGVELEVHASYMQIYLGNVTDLLTPQGAPLSNLDVRETKDGVVVNGVTKRRVQCVEDVVEVLSTGSKRRKVASTMLNSTSSRSHAVLTLYISVWTSKPAETTGPCEDSDSSDRVLAELHADGPLKAEIGAFAKLNIVDLAGSERVKDSGVTGQSLRDACGINLSLFHLSGVVQALVSGAPRVPYSNDKLCFLLKDALGGNCKCVHYRPSTLINSTACFSARSGEWCVCFPTGQL